MAPAAWEPAAGSAAAVVVPAATAVRAPADPAGSVRVQEEERPATPARSVAAEAAREWAAPSSTIRAS
jgi:hypothetical protein